MRTVGIGIQSFEAIRKENYFYVDKTSFIKEWWESRDDVTLIMRPHGFGKSLNMDMLNCFFSNRYAGRSDLFEGTEIWKDEKYRELQGTYPVIYLSFADVKGKTFSEAKLGIIRALNRAMEPYEDVLNQSEERTGYPFHKPEPDSQKSEITGALKWFSFILHSVFKKKVLIFLDDYETPMYEAYVNGYAEDMDYFIQSFCTSAFKANQDMERALLTGVTRIPKDRGFGGFNNAFVCTMTSRKFETDFGFTQEEVDQSLKEYDLSDQKESVRDWYGGYASGKETDIYNPSSILQFLKNQEYRSYCERNHGNALTSHELQIASNRIKSQMEDLLNGGTVETEIDEQISFSRLKMNQEAIWSLLLASGYLKVVSIIFDGEEYHYVLAITNLEVRLMFRKLIGEWFGPVKDNYNDFVRSLIDGNTDNANEDLEQILMNTVSFYDTGKKLTDLNKHESFYHGLVLGMIAQEREYRITSNRESGRGRYDVMMKPLKKGLPGIIIEFKIFDSKREKDLNETAERALKQIADKNYDTELIAEGIPEENIMHYGMAFSGKDVVIIR